MNKKKTRKNQYPQNFIKYLHFIENVYLHFSFLLHLAKSIEYYHCYRNKNQTVLIISDVHVEFQISN